MDHSNHIHSSTGLPDEIRPQMEALLRLCDRYESLELPISPTDFDSETGARTALMWIEGGQLTGFAAMPDDPVPEVSLMIHPDHRRRGIGRALVEAIRAETARRGLDHCLLVADQASPSAVGFLAAIGLPRIRSEFRLQLHPYAIDRPRSPITDLESRLATRADRSTLIRLLSAAFDSPEAEVAPNVDLGLSQPTRDFYLAELHGEPVGAVRIGTWDGNGDITAFGVMPSHQGQGIGRQMLLEAVDRLLAMDLPRILIEVSVDNPSALGLYESCGFRVQREYGYFTLATEP
jgi:ribosomal protein S18 acetylase RimI-like enzyme